MKSIENLLIFDQKKTLNKRSTSISDSETDKMEINLFHLLKASNEPLILFNRIIDWIQVHEGNLIQNGCSILIKREKFL